MSKKKPRQRRQTIHSSKANMPKGKQRGPWKMIVAIATGVIMLIGLVSAILTFLPRLTIDVGSTLDPSNPFTTGFRISNDGYFSVTKLSYKFAMLHLTGGAGPNLNLHGRNVFITGSDAVIPLLRPGEKASLRCSWLSTVAVDAGPCEIEVVVRYRPFVWPVTNEKRFRFEAKKDKAGHWQWSEKASSEEY